MSKPQGEWNELGFHLDVWMLRFKGLDQFVEGLAQPVFWGIPMDELYGDCLRY